MAISKIVFEEGKNEFHILLKNTIVYNFLKMCTLSFIYTGMGQVGAAI